VEDSILIRLPRRDWALCAVEDLRTEGCRGVLADSADGDGQWAIQVIGPEEKIAMMRYEINLAANRICWETFVNEMALV
jgi:hypothetical protein